MHDFSKRPAPQAPLRRRRRRQRWKAPLIGLAGVVMAGSGAVLYSGSKDKTTEPVDPQFCVASFQFLDAFRLAGVPPVGAVPESVTAASIAKALQELGASVDEYQRLAPSKVRSDIRQVVQDLRAAAAEDMAGLRSSRFADAQKRIAVFRETTEACEVGGSRPESSDGS